MAIGARQHCRLFLEGREVPFISAVLNCAPNAPQTASISLVPLGVIKFIQPKTQVHIFVKDTLAFGDDRYFLAFEGEVIGRGYVKEQSGRSFNITAVDYSGYWDEAKAYMMSPNYILGKIGEVATNGEPPPEQVKAAAGASTLSTASTVNNAIVGIINSKPDLVEGMVEVFRRLGNINVLYKSIYDRLRINDRLRVFSSKKIKPFLGQIKTEEFLGAVLGGQGGLVSLRDLLNGVMALVYHEFVTVPFPSKLPVKGTKAMTLGQFLFIPDGYTLPPPKCNVIFPNQQIQFNMADDFKAAPTRYGFRGSFPHMAGGDLSYGTYPMLFYPESFSNYMFKKKQGAPGGMLAAADLLKVGGRTYADVFYGEGKNKAVGGMTGHLKLREADFLTNEEVLRGINFEMEVYPPGVSALVRTSSPASRDNFLREVGAYNFYKKRYGARQASATLAFSPFLIPGFNCVLLDDSDAGQTFLAKLQGITHSLSHEGCSTSIQLGYARDFDEIDALTGFAGEPPIPRWFDDSIFGKKDDALFKRETSYLDGIKYLSADEKSVRDKIKGATTFPSVSKFYNELVGTDSITGIDGDKVLVTIRGAVTWLIQAYKQQLASDNARDSFVYNYVRRSVPTMAEAMAFVGATVNAGNTDVKVKYTDPYTQEEREVIVPNSDFAPDEFATFLYEDEDKHPDYPATEIRRKIIGEYVDRLRMKRGFRG